MLHWKSWKRAVIILLMWSDSHEHGCLTHKPWETMVSKEPVRTYPCSSSSLHIIACAISSEKNELKREENQWFAYCVSSCVSYFKRFAAFWGETVVLLGFFKMPDCVSPNESWDWNFLVNSSILKVRDLVQSPILQMRGKRPEKGLGFAWDHKARLRPSESRVSGNRECLSPIICFGKSLSRLWALSCFGLGEVQWLPPSLSPCNAASA